MVTQLCALGFSLAMGSLKILYMILLCCCFCFVLFLKTMGLIVFTATSFMVPSWPRLWWYHFFSSKKLETKITNIICSFKAFPRARRWESGKCGVRSLLPFWLAGFLFIFHPVLLVYIALVRLLVSMRFILLTFCFKVLLEVVGDIHGFCYLKGIMKCLIEDSLKWNLG